MYELDKAITRHLGKSPTEAVERAMQRFQAELLARKHPLYRVAQGYGLAAIWARSELHIPPAEVRMRLYSPRPRAVGYLRVATEEQLDDGRRPA